MANAARRYCGLQSKYQFTRYRPLAVIAWAIVYPNRRQVDIGVDLPALRAANLAPHPTPGNGCSSQKVAIRPKDEDVFEVEHLEGRQHWRRSASAQVAEPPPTQRPATAVQAKGCHLPHGRRRVRGQTPGKPFV